MARSSPFWNRSAAVSRGLLPSLLRLVCSDDEHRRWSRERGKFPVSRIIGHAGLFISGDVVQIVAIAHRDEYLSLTRTIFLPNRRATATSMKFG